MDFHTDMRRGLAIGVMLGECGIRTLALPLVEEEASGRIMGPEFVTRRGHGVELCYIGSDLVIDCGLYGFQGDALSSYGVEDFFQRIGSVNGHEDRKNS